MEKTNVAVKIIGGEQNGKMGKVILWSDELGYQNVDIDNWTYPIQNEWIKKEEVKMEKKTTMAAKRTGEIVVIENPNKRSGYKMVTVPFEINGKKAEMILEEKYKSSFEPNDRAVKMISWKFVTGDKIIDTAAKIQTDFAMFDIFDIIVDINDIMFDVENLFATLKAKEAEEREAQSKIARAKAYDKDVLLNVIKPALEEKGHDVVSNVTKEEYLKGHDISLTVGRYINVSYNFLGYFIADNGSYGSNRVEKKTKSFKKEKIISIVEDAVSAENYRIKRVKEEKKSLTDSKQTLEKILGINIVEKKEWHSRPSGPRGRSEGYETSYFVNAKYKDTYSDGIRFTEANVSNVIDGKTVYTKGFNITHLPTIVDPVKLKKIYDLLNE